MGHQAFLKLHLREPKAKPRDESETTLAQATY